jgi:hypothetical protein
MAVRASRHCRPARSRSPAHAQRPRCRWAVRCQQAARGVRLPRRCRLHAALFPLVIGQLEHCLQGRSGCDGGESALFQCSYLEVAWMGEARPLAVARVS